MKFLALFWQERIESLGEERIERFLPVCAYASFLLAVMTLVLIFPKFVMAQSEEAEATPGVKKMVISAYYSPLPDQEHYATGSYEGDIRLNGGGVNGADGTPVYPGMIAAPKTFPFGFKMKIPGIGTVAVHDRGGAINGHRLDVWMGYGDIGLKRALNWGKRSVDVEMIGIDESVQESVYLEGYYEAEKFVRNVVKVNRMFPEDIWYQSEGKDVEKLQDALRTLGHYSGEIDGYYGESTLEAVYEFQKFNGIVTSWDDLGAGHCGVQTRTKIEELLKALGDDGSSKLGVLNPNEVFLGRTLSRGDEGKDVIELQKELKRLNFLRIDPTGEFGAVTEHAVFKFQQKMKIVSEKSDLGAGVMGPKTRNELNRIVASRGQVHSLVAAKKADNMVAKKGFVADLDPGSRGEIVKKLQQSLKDLGYFDGKEATAYYGPETEAALLAFQIEKKIVKSPEDLGAGRFGPKTREVLNQLLDS